MHGRTSKAQADDRRLFVQRFLHHPYDIYLVSGSDAYPLDLEGLDTLVVVSKSVMESNPGVWRHIPRGSHVHLHAGSLPGTEDVSELPLKREVHRVIGIGGGSVLDVTKAYLARLVTEGRYGIDELIRDATLLDDYQEQRRDLELRLVPTLFGSAAELTRWCSFWSNNPACKRSLVHSILHADCVIYDEELAWSAPGNATTIAAMDCLAHAMETCWSVRHNVFADTLALAAIESSLGVLCHGMDWLKSSDAHSKLAQATVFSGLAFSQVGTSIAHALSYPLTLAGLPHGLASSVFIGSLLTRFASRRADIYERIGRLFERSGFSLGQGMDAAFDELYECCGARALLKKFPLTGFDPDLAAEQAQGYDKFRQGLVRLTPAEARELYATLRPG